MQAFFAEQAMHIFAAAVTMETNKDAFFSGLN